LDDGFVCHARNVGGPRRAHMCRRSAGQTMTFGTPFGVRRLAAAFSSP
jgi:hypothetical protein